MIDLPVKLLRPHAQAPRAMSAHAAGMDLTALLDPDAPVTLEPGARALIPTGIAIAIPVGYEGQVRPRSGLAVKHGVTVVNAPGTIDADYRGEVQVALVNLGREPFVVKSGERVAQLVIAAVSQATIKVVDDLDATDRGAGGFGSTGR